MTEFYFRTNYAFTMYINTFLKNVFVGRLCSNTVMSCLPLKPVEERDGLEVDLRKHWFGQLWHQLWLKRYLRSLKVRNALANRLWFNTTNLLTDISQGLPLCLSSTHTADRTPISVDFPMSMLQHTATAYKRSTNALKLDSAITVCHSQSCKRTRGQCELAGQDADSFTRAVCGSLCDRGPLISTEDHSERGKAGVCGRGERSHVRRAAVQRDPASHLPEH